MFRDLNLIRKVRNDFAHFSESISFQTPSVKDRCHEPSWNLLSGAIRPGGLSSTRYDGRGSRRSAFSFRLHRRILNPFLSGLRSSIGGRTIFLESGGRSHGVRISPRCWSSTVKRVLCVDDHPDTLDLAAGLFSGYDVTKAATFDEALRHIEEGRFDLYLFDVFLPGGTGWDLVRSVQGAFP